MGFWTGGCPDGGGRVRLDRGPAGRGPAGRFSGWRKGPAGRGQIWAAGSVSGRTGAGPSRSRRSPGGRGRVRAGRDGRPVVEWPSRVGCQGERRRIYSGGRRHGRGGTSRPGHTVPSKHGAGERPQLMTPAPTAATDTLSGISADCVEPFNDVQQYRCHCRIIFPFSSSI